MNENESGEKAWGYYLWIGFFLVLLIWLVYWGAILVLSDTKFATFSEFDPLNTLFSGLAFWGIVFTVLLQKKELALQRTELKLTRQEVEGQKLQLEAQNVTLKQQRFENTFFSLLSLFSDIVNNKEIFSGRSYHGRECFSLFCEQYKSSYYRKLEKDPKMLALDICITAYDDFASRHQNDVGHYFRTLYNIVKFIDGTEIQNKQIYINLLRAQLSSPELALLFYNCLSRYGEKKFKPFVHKYGLLENMNFNDLIDKEHRSLYLPQAFESLE